MSTRREVIRLLALGLLIMVLFLPVTRHGFSLYDDPQYVTGNPLVLGGPSIAGLMNAATAFVGGNWHPITLLSHMTDVALFGEHASGHHLTSVLLHALATLLIAAALTRLTGSAHAAFVAALIWAIHPVRVESVAWIAERKDLLAAAALGGVLLAYQRYVARPGPARYAALLAMHAVGLAAKPVLVTTPLLLLVIDAWPLGRLRPRAIIEKIPLLALSAAAGMVAVFAQRSEGTVIDGALLPLGARLGNAVDALVRYIGMTLWPAGLAVFYPHPEGALSSARLAGDVALLAGVSLLAAWQSKRRPWLAAGWVWYLIALAPVLGILQVGAQARADRYLTIPLIGLLAMLVGTASEIGGGSVRGRRARAAIIAAVAAAMLVVTTRQIATWRSDRVLFNHALNVAGESAVAHYVLGLDAVRRRDDDAAVAELRAALAYSPSAVEPRHLLADALERLGRYGESADEMTIVLANSPFNPIAEADLGLLCESLGRYEQAVRHLERAAAAGVLPVAVQRRLETLRELQRRTIPQPAGAE